MRHLLIALVVILLTGCVSVDTDEIVNGDGYQNVLPPGVGDESVIKFKEKETEDDDVDIFKKIENKIWGG